MSPLPRIAAARLLAAIADQLLLFAVPLLIYSATGSAARSGLAFFIEWLPRVLYLPFAGVLADRLPARGLFVWSDAGRAGLALGAFAVVQLELPGALGWLNAAAAAIAVLNAQAFVALERNLPLNLPASDLGKAQALLQGCDQLSQLLGPALAALLVTVLEAPPLVALAAGLFGGSAALTSTLRLRGLEGERARRSWTSGWSDLRRGAALLRAHRGLWSLSALAVLINLLVGVSLAVSAPMTLGKFERPGSSLGLLCLLQAVTSVVALTAVSRFGRPERLAAIGAAAFGVSCGGAILTGLAPSFGLYALGTALVLGGVGPVNVYIRTTRARIIPREDLGKTIGLIVLVNQLPLPAAGLLVATASGRFGVGALPVAVGLFAIAAALSLLLTQRLFGARHEAARVASNPVPQD